MFNWFNTEQKWSYDDLPTPTTEEEYIKLAKQVIENRKTWLSSNNGWELIIDEDNIMVFQYELEDSPVHMIKATTILRNVNIEDVLNWSYKATLDEKKLILDDVIDHQIVKNINPNIHVSKSRYATPTGISNREFLALRVSHMLDNKTHIVGIQSINMEEIPFDNDYVRGVSNCTTLLEDLGENTIRITSVDHIDPKGWIPAFVINAYKKKAKERLERLQDVYGKN